LKNKNIFGFVDVKLSVSNVYPLFNILLSLLATCKLATAQSIQTDGTTPTQPESCSGDCIIEGGLQRGNKLFHSFERFKVDSGAKVLFQDSGAVNILTRVTSNQPSEILGTLGVQNGNANLFLINPNGIIFGANSSLDLNGSFIATTANAIRFGEQGFLNTVPDNIPLLTINPSALFFAQGNRGVITNESTTKVGEYV
jgi:filamentous hemagglutinin family protein